MSHKLVGKCEIQQIPGNTRAAVECATEFVKNAGVWTPVALGLEFGGLPIFDKLSTRFCCA